MKNWLLTICLSLLSIQAFCQETKFVLKKRASFNEEFYVLKSDKKIKHGTYVKYETGSNKVHLLESGSYENGQKSGFWHYFHESYDKYAQNRIKAQGHYVNGKKNGLWTFYYLDTIPVKATVETYGKRRKLDSISVNIEPQSLRLKLAGRYLNDRRVGEWTSLTYDGKLYQKYDFYKSQLITDRSLKDSLEYNKNRRALFVGGLPCFGELISSEFSFTKVVTELDHDSTSVLVTFKIDRNGHVSEPAIFQSNASKIFEKEAIRVMELTDNSWIPALLDGKIIESNYKVEITIIRRQDLEYPIGARYTLRYGPILDN